MQKRCTKCLEEKDIKFFCKRKKSKDGLNTWCKSCVTANNKINYHRDIEKSRRKSREWDALNRSKRFNSEIKHKFNITIETYDQMLVAQNYKCAICKISKDLLNERLAVDHCHKTDKIRGLLCGNCNRAIGIFKDDPTICESAANYLKNNK